MPFKSGKKDCDLVYGQNLFDRTVKHDKRTYDNIRKIATGQRGNYTTGFLLDYPYFLENYKLIVIDLSKQQTLNANSKTIQEINFTGNLETAGNITMFFIIKAVKGNILDFLRKENQSIGNSFCKFV